MPKHYTCSNCRVCCDHLYAGNTCEDCYLDMLADTQSTKISELTYEEATARFNDAGEESLSVEQTLIQRGNRYGDFSEHAEISQQLKEVIYSHMSMEGVKPYMRESMEMICHKLARIANGDPYYDDSWRDIAGYAQLVVDELNKDSNEA